MTREDVKEAEKLVKVVAEMLYDTIDRYKKELKKGQDNYNKLWDMYSELKKDNKALKTVNDKLTFKVGDWCWYQGGHLIQIIDIDEYDFVVAKSVSPIVNKVFFKGFEHCELFVGKLPSSIKGEQKNGKI